MSGESEKNIPLNKEKTIRNQSDSLLSVSYKNILLKYPETQLHRNLYDK